MHVCSSKGGCHLPGCMSVYRGACMSVLVRDVSSTQLHVCVQVCMHVCSSKEAAIYLAVCVHTGVHGCVF